MNTELRKLISTIIINKANFDNISSSGIMNGTLLIEIERVCNEYKQSVKSSLKRDIEKRIDELGIPDYTNEAAYAKLELLNKFLELIETVEP